MALVNWHANEVRGVYWTHLILLVSTACKNFQWLSYGEWSTAYCLSVYVRAGKGDEQADGQELT